MPIFKTKAEATKSAMKRKAGFRTLIKKAESPGRKKFLKESIKTVKIRKLSGSPMRFEVLGR